ncbi:MAG: cytochrome C oxidase subunit IV family protein [Aureliella sp.]
MNADRSESKRLLVTFAALLALLVATIAVSFVPLGPMNVWLALAIAVAKTLLIALVFMRLASSSWTMTLAACAGLLCLAIAVTCTLADFHTRGWEETVLHDLPSAQHIDAYDRQELR